LLAACGGGGPNPPGQTVSVTVTPTTLQLAPGQTSEITATVTGTSDTSVTWSASGGTLAESGSTVTYTAPDSSGTYTVTATSNADTSKRAQATVQVAAGAPTWLYGFGSPASDLLAGLALDTGDSAVVVGLTAGALQGHENLGGQDGFVVKVGPDGAEVWADQFGTAQSDSANGVTTDAADAIYVVGTTLGTLGSTRVGSYDAFVRKYAADGEVLWTTQYGTAVADSASAVVVDAAGNVFIAGGTDGVFSGNTSSGASDAYVAMFDEAGSLQWVRQFGASADSSTLPDAMALADDGSIYVVGATSGAFPDQTLTSQYDAFLAKLAADGEPLWFRQMGSGQHNSMRAVAVDADGSVLVAGYTMGELVSGQYAGDVDAFVMKYAPDGGLVWARQFGTEVADSPYSLVVDSLGAVKVVGVTQGELPGATRTGVRDLFVADLNGATGEVSGFWQYGLADATLLAEGIALAADGDQVIAGNAQPGFTDPEENFRDGFVLRRTP